MRRIYTLLISKVETTFRFDANYFIRGGVWLMIGQLVITALGLLTTMLLAHYLDEATYGIYRYLIGLAVIFSAFSLTGLGQAILQTAAIGFTDFYRNTIRTNFIYSTGISLLGLTGFAYYFINENMTLAIGCLFIAVLQPITNSFQFVPTFLQGAGRFKESTILHSVRTFFISSVTIATVLITQNVLWLFGVYLLSSAIANVVSHLLFKPEAIVQIKQDLQARYLRYAKHTSARNAILNVSFRADSVIIFTQLGAVELAVYTIAMVIPEQIKNTFKNLSTMLLPKFAKRIENGNVMEGIPKRSLQLFALLFIIALMYVLAAPFIYQLIFPKYEEAIFLSQLLALSFPALAGLLPSSALEAQLHEKKLYWFNITNSIVTLASTLFGVLLFGLVGAIAGKVFSRYVYMVLAYAILYFKRHT